MEVAAAEGRGWGRRGVPPARAPGRRLGGGLHGKCGVVPGAVPGRSRGYPRRPRPGRRSSPEPLRRRARRPRPDHPPRRHPLAVAELLRLLPRQASGPSCSASWWRPASACRGCSGRRAPPAPSWRPTSSTGWSTSGPADRFRSGGRRRRHQDSASSATLCALLAPHGTGRPAAPRAPMAPVSRPDRLHLQPGALLGREGGAHRRARTRQPAPHRRRPTSPCARRPRAAIVADEAAGRRPCFVTATVGTTSSTALDPVVAAIAAHLRPPRRVAARRRPMAGSAARLPRAALRERRARGRRQLLLQPPQVAADELRLRLLLRGRPRRADRRPQRPARVPAQRGVGVGRGDRLPRLADPARPPLPGPQAVVRAPAPTGPRGLRRHIRRASAWPRSWLPGWKPTPTSSSPPPSP